MQLRLRRWPAWLVASALCFSAFATQIESRSLTQLGQEAELVVQGKVQNVRSFWNDAHTRILTEVQIEVSDSHKGSAQSELRVVQMGGVVDGVRMTVHGAAVWSLGQDVLLFLEPSLPGSYRLSGFTQGRFDLTRDVATGQWIARRSLLGAEVAGKQDASAVELSLGELLKEALSGVEGER
jgi:hypothetical protein